LEQTSVVVANAAAAINCFESDKSFDECREAADESLRGGKAMELFKKLMDNQ
jgi:anthranilate phosphoribosyltransferase